MKTISTNYKTVNNKHPSIQALKIVSLEPNSFPIPVPSSSVTLTYQQLLSNPLKTHFTPEERSLLLTELFNTDIPFHYRKNLWLISSNAQKQITSNPNYYLNLTSNYPDYIPSPYEVQLELDLPRTFPKEPFFKNESNLKRLHNILLAYTRRNYSIGYCQGFNFIVGRILEYINNEVSTIYLDVVVYRKKLFGYLLN